MTEERIYAVLTGDVVDSSRLQHAGLPVSEQIIAAGEQVRLHFQARIHGQIDVFRGDSWQMVVSEPEVAVRVGLYLRALLRAEYGFDSRVSIGFGKVDFLPTENISTGTGQAFALSGQGLDECQKPIRMALRFASARGKQAGQGLNTIIRLVDLQAGRWTPSQSRAVAGGLIDMTQAQIASRWQPEPVSQQAISQHLENAGWIPVKEALEYLESALPGILAQNLDNG